MIRIDDAFTYSDNINVPVGPVSKIYQLSDRYLVIRVSPAGTALFDVEQDQYVSDAFSLSKLHHEQELVGVGKINEQLSYLKFERSLAIVNTITNQLVSESLPKLGYFKDLIQTNCCLVITEKQSNRWIVHKINKFTGKLINLKTLTSKLAEAPHTLFNFGNKVFASSLKSIYRVDKNYHLSPMHHIKDCKSQFADPNDKLVHLIKTKNHNSFFDNCNIYNMNAKTQELSILYSFSEQEKLQYKALSTHSNRAILKVGKRILSFNEVGNFNTYMVEKSSSVGGFANFRVFNKFKLNWASEDSGQFTLLSPLVSRFSGFNKAQLETWIGTNKLRQAIFTDEHSLWVATQNNGLHLLNLNQATQLWSPDVHLLPGEQVRALYNHKNTIWIGTEKKGIYSYDTKADKLTKLEVPKEIVSAFGFLPLDDNTLLVNSFNNGFLTVDLSKKTVKQQLWPISKSGEFVKLRGIRAVKKGLNGDLLIGTHTRENTYLRLNNELEVIEAYGKDQMLNNHVFDVLEDKEHNTWLATWGGGIAFKPANKDSFIFITMSHGLPSNTIYSINQSADGAIWVSSSAGLVRINKYKTNTLANWEFRQFDKNDGLTTDTFDSEGFSIQTNGTFMYGGISGLVWFDPVKDIKFNSIQPSKSFVTNLTINGSSYSKLTNAKNNFEQISKVRLSYDSRNIALSFAAPSYILPHKNQYQYRLNNQSWIALKKPEIVFAQLAPARYDIEVRGSNNDGVWSVPTKLTLIVAPPWWQSTYAYITYIMMLLMFALLFSVWRTRRINTRNQYLEQQVQNRTEQLQKAIQSKERLFEEISHEFRTPLTLIIGKTELLLKAERPKNAALDIIYGNAKKLYSLVENLLKLAEIQAALNLPIATNIDFEIRQVFFRLTPLAEHKNIKVHLNIEFMPKQTAHMLVEQTIDLVFGNILSNAIKYSPANTKIEVNVHKFEECLSIEVSDQGIGFANLETATHRFYQESNISEGNGLGLSIVHKMVSLNNGQLSFKNNPQIGACITVTLPLVESETYMQIDEEQEKHLATEMPDCQILIVEDNIHLRNHLIELFPPNVKVKSAENGIKALDILEDFIPELILSDVMMPAMDGFELCNRIKSNEDYKHIPFILLTAKGDILSEKIGLQKKADDYIAKPFSSATLLQKLSNRIYTYRAFKENLLRSVVTPKTKEVDSSCIWNETTNKIQTQLELHYCDPDYNSSKLAAFLCMSEKTLNRRLKLLFSMTFSQLLREYRLERANEKLFLGNTAQQVAFECGFSSAAYFGQCFKERYGYSPGHAKKKSITKEQLN
ncbi:response regulator [uncultured Paraglaciecola sp.]|uniref:hybrid sensor histidine kinase/response regulator transcription factor n=1 Tax=uncultured Paraglaciecola sp. TaxID=1765024 RepID=UPI002632649F|nr:response regulator [uncultured Paraglaciecola sp.]